MNFPNYAPKNNDNNLESLKKKENAHVAYDFTTNNYLNKLVYLHGFALSILLISSSLKLVSITTNEWYVLNVNEYIPISKGGLWSYCFIATTGYHEQFTCMKYEELPNFAVFINQRLYTSRILLLCSTGFLGLLSLMEIIGRYYILFIHPYYH